MRRYRGLGVVRGLSVVGLLAGLVLGLSPTAAQAEGWRTANSTADGANQSAVEAMAKLVASEGLTIQADQAGETCTNVSVTATLVWIAPGGAAYVYQGTARGFCAVTPPFTVYRTSTRQAGSTNASAAFNSSRQLAQNDILAAGINCTNWVVQSHLISASGGWFVYDSSAYAVCTN